MKINKKFIHLILICFLLTIVFIACSSAPKKPDGIYDTRNQAAEYLSYGWNSYNKGLYTKAEDFFLQALQNNLLVDNTDGVVRSYIALMQNSIAQDKRSAAEEYFNRAGEWLSFTGDENLLFEYRLAEGQLLKYMGKDKEAKKVLLDVIASYPSAEKELPTKLATALNTLATIEKNNGNYAEALEYANRAMELNSKEKNFTGIASSYYIIAAVYARQEDIAAAIENLELSLENDKKAENSTGIAKTLSSLASLYYKNSDKEKAYMYYKRSLMIYIQLENAAEIQSIAEKAIAIAKELGKTEEQQKLTEISDKYKPKE